jgi:hypothetical protein
MTLMMSSCNTRIAGLALQEQVLLVARQNLKSLDLAPATAVLVQTATVALIAYAV